MPRADRSAVRVAVVCMESRPGAVEENLRRMGALAGEAASRGAHIVCFPELSVTGYILKNPRKTYSENTYEKVLEKINDLAREIDAVVLAGLIEPAEKRPCIAHAVAGPDGVSGIYRKTHLSPQESKVYKAGDEIGTFHGKGATFGIQLCYECHFPEISTVLALGGSDIFFMPHASPRGTPSEKLDSWLRHMTARAFDNAVFVAACNQVSGRGPGMRFPGVGVVIGPDGRVMAQYTGDGEHVLMATLDMGLLEDIRGHRMRYFLPNRRPELYGPIGS